jgi:hypothetical protein
MAAMRILAIDGCGIHGVISAKALVAGLCDPAAAGVTPEV